MKLRPARLDEKNKIFNWLTQSDLTQEMMGVPNYPDCPVPGWEEFDQDYKDYYFEDASPSEGRCFIIQYADQEIGQINYNKVDLINGSTELDIWLCDSRYTGMGLGLEAINLLVEYLRAALLCRIFFMAPSLRNDRAIKAYQKAGFKVADEFPDDFHPDYKDAVLMVKIIE
ncbi:MAG: GNAT family N-acetyltransferase [Saprospiraceae bacterium]|nr:GNAT family N-acetyltransferase [Saprospiraceae bacterium]